MMLRIEKFIAGCLFLAVIMLCFYSCGEKNIDSETHLAKVSSTLTPPVKILASHPVCPLPDTCAPPVTTLIPVTASHQNITLKNGIIITPAPPEVKKAGFFAHMQHYNTEQGLALSAIACSYRDRNGNLWFGSYGGGVSRYDGKSFTTYTTAQGLANNTVWGMTQDKHGNLWFATFSGGVSCFDGQSFHTYTTSQGLSDNTVYCITEDRNGILWFGTQEGLSRYDGTAFTRYTTAQGLSNNTIQCITEDKAGNLWLGTHGGGACRYDGKTFTAYTTTQGLAHNGVRSIMQDSKGLLWFGTQGGGASCYDGKSFINYTTVQGLAENHVRCITEDKHGNLWFGTQGGGMSCFDGHSFTTYSVKEGLAHDIVLCITPDKSGNLWIGTYSGGVSRFDGTAFTTYTTVQGLAHNSVFSIMQDRKGNHWFGTQGAGVCRYDGQTFTTYGMNQGLPNNIVFGMMEASNGDLWFGTEGGGVSCYDGKSFITYTTAQGLTNNNVAYIIEDRKGNKWFGTHGGGVSCFDGKKFTNYTTTQGLAHNFISCMLEDKNGTLWFGTQGAGLCRFDGTSFTTYTTAQGLAHNTISALTEDKQGNLWIATYGGGVSILPPEKNRNDEGTENGKPIFVTITTEQGLANDGITNILEGLDGKIYIATNWGISVIKGWKDKTGTIISTAYPGETANALPVFDIYNQKTGCPIKDANTGEHGMFMDRKGIIWAGTGDDNTALVRFDPSALNENQEAPHLELQAIKLNEENVCWHLLDKTAQTDADHKDSISITPQIMEEVTTFGRRLKDQELDTMRIKFSGVRFHGIRSFYPIPEQLVLPYADNNVTFVFQAIEPARSFLVHYQYRLDGYDKNWSPATTNTSATFGNIYEGSYTFMLRAQSPEGRWCEPVRYSFTVRPPWYRTWWMYGIYGLSAFIFMFRMYRWRTASLRKDKEILETTVAVRTAEVREQKEEAEKQKEMVEAKQKEILDSIHYAKRIQQALLTSNGYFRKYLSEEYFILFKPKDIVSGDFYWALHLPGTHSHGKGLFYLATADCTGHGVPGAFMSMLNISLLNEMVVERHITNPAEVLNMVRKEIIHALNPEGSEEESRDGMDAVLCCFDLDKMELRFAAANNPVWILRDGKLTIYKGDKMPVGKYHNETAPFSLQTVPLKKGDIVYTTTDGYPDQFGGSKGKKFKYKQLEEKIQSIASLPLTEQKQILDQTFTAWKGNLEQVDDVTIIGIRV